jgi:hypothetical protein
MIAAHIAAEANRPLPIGLSLNKNIYKALHREGRALGIEAARIAKRRAFCEA